tara:strand:+ start:130 stop:531 length:402 start_codon:yes stop_codon:yes gene_type:complete
MYFKYKKLIIFIFTLSLVICNYSFAIEKIYYCSEISATGFDPKENFKRKNYNTSRFKAKIDINNNFFSSKDLFMTNTKCERMVGSFNHLMQCHTIYGSTFVLNTNNFKFGITDLIGMNGNDDIYVAHGTCEEF